LERQDLIRTYLAHHELESNFTIVVVITNIIIIIIIFIAVVIVIIIIIVVCLHSCIFPDRFATVLFCMLACMLKLHTLSVGYSLGASDVWKHCAAEPKLKIRGGLNSNDAIVLPPSKVSDTQTYKAQTDRVVCQYVGWSRQQ